MQEWPARWRRRRATLLSTPPLRRTAILRGFLSGIEQERYALGSMETLLLRVLTSFCTTLTSTADDSEDEKLQKGATREEGDGLVAAGSK